MLLFEKTENLTRLSKKEKQVEERRRHIAHLERELTELPKVHKARLHKLQTLESEWSKSRAALQAMAAGLEVVAADKPVKAGGQTIKVGQTQILTEDSELRIGSSIRLRIQPGGGTSLAEARKIEADAGKDLREALDTIGLKTPQGSVNALARRDELSSLNKAAQAELKAMEVENLAEELKNAQNDLIAAEANAERLAALAPDLKASNDKTAAKVRLLPKYMLLNTHGGDTVRANALIGVKAGTTAAQNLLKTNTDAITAPQPDLLEGDVERIRRAIKQETENRNQAEQQIAVAHAALHSDGSEDPQVALATAEAKARAASEHRNSVQLKSQAVALRNAQPMATGRQLRESHAGLVTWLYRHDREWMLRNMPRDLCRARPKTAVDWHARDELVCGQVVTVTLQIKSAPGKPQRISFATINREIRARLRLYIDTKQMPLTRLALKGVVETPEQFSLRRTHYVAKSFVAENATPPRSDLLRAAGINPQRKISGIIMDATDGVLAEISCSAENLPTPRFLF